MAAACQFADGPDVCRTAAREELRLQLGTLRFDLNTLGATKPGKSDKKKAILLKQDFIKKVEQLLPLHKLQSQMDPSCRHYVYATI